MCVFYDSLTINREVELHHYLLYGKKLIKLVMFQCKCSPSVIKLPDFEEKDSVFNVPLTINHVYSNNCRTQILL